MEDWFLRLDPYNFDTEEEFEEFHAETKKENTKEKVKYED